MVQLPWWHHLGVTQMASEWSLMVSTRWHQNPARTISWLQPDSIEQDRCISRWEMRLQWQCTSLGHHVNRPVTPALASISFLK